MSPWRGPKSNQFALPELRVSAQSSFLLWGGRCRATGKPRGHGLRQSGLGLCGELLLVDEGVVDMGVFEVK